MDHPGDLADSPPRQPQGVRVASISPATSSPPGRAERRGPPSPRIAGHGNGLGTGQADRGRVGAVGRVGMITPRSEAPGRLVVGAHHQQPGELAGPPAGAGTSPCHPGQLAQKRSLRQERPVRLGEGGRVAGCRSVKPGALGRPVGDLRVVLHGAGAEGVGPQVHREAAVGEASVKWATRSRSRPSGSGRSAALGKTGSSGTSQAGRTSAPSGAESSARVGSGAPPTRGAGRLVRPVQPWASTSARASA